MKTNAALNEILQKLTSSEIVCRGERTKKINITISFFLFVKTLKDFDYQPQINRSYIEYLAKVRFTKEHNNIIKITGQSYRIKGRMELTKEENS